MPGALCIGSARDAPRSSGLPWDMTLGFHWFTVARQGARSAPCVGTGFIGHRSNAHFAEGPSASGDCKVKPQATHAATAQQGQGPVYHMWFQNGTESEDEMALQSPRSPLSVDEHQSIAPPGDAVHCPACGHGCPDVSGRHSEQCDRSFALCRTAPQSNTVPDGHPTDPSNDAEANGDSSLRRVS